MLKERLDAADLALVDILEDPIFFAEFMRSTRDGSVNKELWPKKPFEYRHYQRALISDQSEKIALLGGRAIGKCQPITAMIYTTRGYKPIYELRRTPTFEVYCFNEEGRLTSSRGILQKDQWTKTYKVTTESGYTTVATAIHPFFTDSGYVQLKNLMIGDSVGIVTRLPWTSQQRLWRWQELRLFGYIFLNKTWRLDIPLTPRFKRIKEDLRKIAVLQGTMLAEDGMTVQLTRKSLRQRSIIRQIAREMKFHAAYIHAGHTTNARHVPATLKEECIEHLQWFLEAVFAQFAELSRKSITLDCKDHRCALDIQELLLRFGIETLVTDAILKLRDERAIYRFYTTFDLPGVSVENIEVPPQSLDPSPDFRFEKITEIRLEKERDLTYSLYVYDHHNYITGHMRVHNSLVMEDKILFETLNQDSEFPETKESLLATANQNQLNPLLGRLINRFTTSPLLKDFLQNRINRSMGVFDFRFGELQYLIHARIAGATGQQNMVALHLPRMKIDESQIFSISAWNQLTHALNA